MTVSKYALIYIWNGERHRHLQEGPLEVMLPILNEMKAKRWRAWLEVL